jgi:hypothetical protein
MDKGASEAEAFEKIAKSATTPNTDINGLLGKFGEWLGSKPDAYLDRVLGSIGGG